MRQETLVPARVLIHKINNESPFVEAQRHLGLFPQKIYKMMQYTSFERVKRVLTFVLSIYEDNESYFYYDVKTGVYDPTREGVRNRARKMAIAMGQDTKKKCLAKFAGNRYLETYAS